MALASAFGTGAVIAAQESAIAMQSAAQVASIKAQAAASVAMTGMQTAVGIGNMVMQTLMQAGAATNGAMQAGVRAGDANMRGG